MSIGATALVVGASRGIGLTAGMALIPVVIFDCLIATFSRDSVGAGNTDRETWLVRLRSKLLLVATMKLFPVCLSILLLSACTSTTMIRSSDPDARIYVNGEYIGTGQAAYSDRKVAFSRNDVELRKEGCAPSSYSFRRNEDPDGGAIVGGFLFAVPFLWVTEYKDERAYEYACRPVAATVQ